MKRLEILLKKLDDEGWHVRANTVWLAIEEIKRLTDEDEADDALTEIAEENAAWRDNTPEEDE